MAPQVVTGDTFETHENTRCEWLLVSAVHSGLRHQIPCLNVARDPTMYHYLYLMQQRTFVCLQLPLLGSFGFLNLSGLEIMGT